MANSLISTLTIIVFIYSHPVMFSFCFGKSTPNIHQSTRTTKKSGHPSPNPLVGDYRKAREDEFPYLVMLSEIQDDNWILCAGTLLKPNWVVTARHCILYFDFNNQTKPQRLREVVVTPKYSNKRSKLNGTKKYKVSKIFCNHVTNDGYDSLVADVAMLKLSESVPIGTSPYLFKTVRMVEREDQIDWKLKFRVPGWGSTKRGIHVTKKDYPDDLLVIDPYFEPSPYEKCRAFFPHYVSPQTFCLGDSNRTTSFGDWGGPAIARDDKTDEDLQAAIFSRGINVNGEMNGPSLFANMSYYSLWILNTMLYENPDDECKNLYGL